MTDVFKEIPNSGGGWFKPTKELLGAVAFMIEVRGFDRQRPTAHGPKDSALCDITIFTTADELNNLEPNSITAGCRIEQSALARDLATLVGSATIVTLGQSKPKAGQQPAWIFNAPTLAVKKQVMAYYQAREAALAAVLADAPDF